MELLILNGNVVTLDARSSRAQAVAIRDGIIVAVGDDDTVLRYRTPKAQVLDAQGRTVLPGLNEPHGHLHVAAEMAVGLSVRTPPCQNIADIVETIRQAASTTPPGEPIIGYGLSYLQLSERRKPTRQELDRGSAVHPVAMKIVGDLEAVVNSKALELAGITKDTPDPDGGKIGRDPITGEPDGRLTNYSAMSTVIKHLPPRPRESYLQGLRLAQDQFLHAGITSFCEPKLSHYWLTRGIENLKAYQRGVREGVLKIRIYNMIHNNILKDISFVVESGLGDSRHRIGGASIIQDGGIISRAAALREPYQGTAGERGWLCYPQAELDEMVRDMHQQGYQILIHANGDWGMDSALQALEQAQTSYPRASPRHRIERCIVCNDEQIQRMKHLGVVPGFSVQLLALQGDAYRDGLLGPERAAKVCPVGSALRAGLPALLHSETMVPAPLYNVQCAVTRKTRSGLVLGPEERISVEEALRCVTINPAWFTFEERLKGTLEVGKFGDVTILEADPFAVSPDEIGHIPVSATIIGGEIAYACPEIPVERAMSTMK